MDSMDLIYIKKNNLKSHIKPKINSTKKTKFLNCLKYVDLKLIILCSILISNLYLIYLFKSIFNFTKISHQPFLQKLSKSV